MHYPTSKKIQDSIDDTANTLKRKLVSIYLSSYNLINLKSKKGRIQPVQREAAREKVLRKFDWNRIIPNSADAPVQVLLTLPKLSVNTAVRRICFW